MNESKLCGLLLGYYFSGLCSKGLTLFQQQSSDSSKLIEFLEDNFRFDDNGGKFFKRVEISVGKKEMACYEQFLLFAQSFPKIYTADPLNIAFFGKG